MSPQNWLCRSERNSALDTSSLFTSGPQMETTQTLPQIPDIQNYTVTLNTIPHTSRNTRCHINIPLRHFVSNTNKSKLHESCSTKSKPYSMLQIKTFFVVLLKKSFVIHLCCLQNIVLRKITISRNAIRSFLVVSGETSVELVHRFLCITPKRIKTGINGGGFGGGKYLIG